MIEGRPSFPSGVQSDDAIDRAMSGDMEALGELFVRYGPFVRRVLVGVLGMDSEIDDAVQDVFLEVHRSIRRFRKESAFTTWLHPIAVRCAWNRLRRRKRRREPLMASMAPSERTPFDDLVGQRLLDSLFRVLDAMPPGRRTAFILFEVEGHSIEEVARLMSSGRAAAKSRIFFARRELMRRAGADSLLASLLAELQEERRSREGTAATEGIHVKATEK